MTITLKQLDGGYIYHIETEELPKYEYDYNFKEFVIVINNNRYPSKGYSLINIRISKTSEKDNFFAILNFQIKQLEKEYEKISEKEYVERALCLGKINGLLTAKLYAIDLNN